MLFVTGPVAHQNGVTGKFQLQAVIDWRTAAANGTLFRAMQVNRRFEPRTVLSSLLCKAAHLHRPGEVTAQDLCLPNPSRLRLLAGLL